jgi:hypothetical protein
MYKMITLSLAILLLSATTVFAEGPSPAMSPDNLKETKANVEELAESLTPEQKGAIHTILTQYEPQLAEVTEAFKAIGQTQDAKTIYIPMVMSSGSTAAATAETQAFATPPLSTAEMQDLQEVTEQLVSLQAQIDAEVAQVLSPEQQELFASLSSALNNVSLSDDPSLNYDYSSAYYYGYYSYEANYYGAVFAEYEYYYDYSEYAYYSYYYNYYGYAYAYYTFSYLN